MTATTVLPAGDRLRRQAAALDIFRSFPAHVLDRVVAVAEWRTVAPGRELLDPGAKSPAALVIVEGAATLTSSAGVVGPVGPGTVLRRAAVGDAMVNAAADSVETTVLVFDEAGWGLVEAAAWAVREASLRRTSATAASGGGPRRRRRVVRAVLGLLAVVAVVAAGGTVWVLRERQKTTPVGVDQVVAAYRQRAAADPAPLADAAPSVVDEGSPVVAPGASAPRASVPGGPAAAEPSAPTAAGPSAGVDQPVEVAAGGPATTGFAPPAPGVYAYDTEGHEAISMLGGRHDYPDRTYAAVNVGDGCAWSIEHAVVEEHVDRRQRCSAPGQLLGISESRYLTFFGQTDGLEFVCDPPMVLADAGDAPGATRTSTCRSDDGDVNTATITYVGPEVLDVDGTGVDVHHVAVDFAFTGRADGTTHSEFWYHATTGLIVQEHRTTDTVADAAFGADVRYTEDAQFRLVSLDPQR